MMGLHHFMHHILNTYVTWSWPQLQAAETEVKFRETLNKHLAAAVERTHHRFSLGFQAAHKKAAAQAAWKVATLLVLSACFCSH